MSVVQRHARRRWALVVAGAAVLVAAPLVVARLPADASADPVRLRASVVASGDLAYQGVAESSGVMALPELPRLADVSSLLNSTTTVRVWHGSSERWRFDVVTTAGERDVYRSAEGESVWDYGANQLTRLVGKPAVRLPRADDLMPPELARRVLSTGPDDPVTALPARRVAGVDAAGLRLVPADPDTAIGQVDVWADPASGLPVMVEVTARGGDRPVLSTRFLELAQSPPDPAVLVPPDPVGAGFAVVDAPDLAEALGLLGRQPPPARLAGRPLTTADPAGVRGVGVYGTGLSAFVALPVPRDVGAAATDAATKAGGKVLDLPGGSAVRLSVAPLSMVVVRSEVARRWYLVTGMIAPAVLDLAAAELSVVPRSGR